jgi:hypothetical protein
MHEWWDGLEKGSKDLLKNEGKNALMTGLYLRSEPTG